MPRRPRRTHRLYSVSVNRVGLSAKVHSAQPRPNVDRSRCLMKGSFVRRSHADLSSSRTEAASFVRARGPFNYSASHLAVGYGMARRIRMPSDLSLRSRNKIKKKKKAKERREKRSWRHVTVSGKETRARIKLIFNKGQPVRSEGRAGNVQAARH